MIDENIDDVRQRISVAAKRSGHRAGDIALVAVTKNVLADAIREAISCGVKDIGENKVQEAKLKYSCLVSREAYLVKREACHCEAVRPKQSPTYRGLLRSARNDVLLRFTNHVSLDTSNELRWHMIGHLQTNKAKDAVGIFDLIQSVDSLKLAQAINTQAKRVDKVQNILVEVKTSGEAAKYGLAPEGLKGLLSELDTLENISVLGLMTMAPVVSNQEEARPYFRRARELFEAASKRKYKRVNMKFLSMGMSDDFEAAVEEGANMVRVGRAIFG